MTAPVCPACGRPLPRLRVVCQCGHAETSHEINRAGKRTHCCHYAPAGRCGCQAFTLPPAPDVF